MPNEATGAADGGPGYPPPETTSAPSAAIRIPPARAPLVSIIVVTYGTGPVVLDALAAVADHTSVAVEVVVVDNPAPGRPPTGDIVRAATAGVVLVSPGENLGFGGGNDLGVSLTTGELVCFLNPDVVVAAGWLEPLVAALDDPIVGIAGPVLLNPDGTIQEAGRVVYRDGWTGAIAGRDMLTGDREQLFARDADYLSAACWLVRRDEHVARGGFDDRFHPAFFEDVDYALRVEAGGQRSRLVVDVPVVHAHGLGGAGKDAQPHASHQMFCAVWETWLGGQLPAPESDLDARVARDRLAAAHSVWIDRPRSVLVRRARVAEAVADAVAHPRRRVTLITGASGGPEFDRARRAGVEVVQGDVDALLADRRPHDDLVVRTTSPELPGTRSTRRIAAAVVLAVAFALHRRRRRAVRRVRQVPS